MVNKLPDIGFGEPFAEEPLSPVDDTDDDEQLTATPADVVEILGFDPLEGTADKSRRRFHLHVHDGPITIESPRNPDVYATLEERPGGVLVAFWRREKGTSGTWGARPLKLLSREIIDAPMHVLSEKVFRILGSM